jgi:antitoxin (DNA-binding transcriptional repressor) of toxin-antitoxin stability system
MEVRIAQAGQAVATLVAAPVKHEIGQQCPHLLRLETADRLAAAPDLKSTWKTNF